LPPLDEAIAELQRAHSSPGFIGTFCGSIGSTLRAPVDLTNEPRVPPPAIQFVEPDAVRIVRRHNMLPVPARVLPPVVLVPPRVNPPLPPLLALPAMEPCVDEVALRTVFEDQTHPQTMRSLNYRSNNYA
jgi:hypothetical protein